MDKKAKLFSTRAIRTQVTDPAYKEGLLSVPDFINARKFEIKSFEMSQLKTRASSANRVFQSLPRVMRRRTASHNVKRVPKRLRNRAKREMEGTNVIKKKSNGKQIYKLKMSKKLLRLASRIKLMRTVPSAQEGGVKARIDQLNQQLNQLKSAKNTVKPQLNNVLGSYDNTGINELTNKPRGNLKYTKRQKEFVWLATHVWHAKRAHLMKKWGYQIPLAPTQKAFKSINRASKSGTVIFDTSYYDSLIIQYDEEVIKGLIDAKGPVLAGKKSYSGWLNIDGVRVGQCVAYCNRVSDKVLIRVHPSIYEEFFNYLVARYPHLTVQDCRYSLGSIDLIGPTSLRNLNLIFHITKDVPEFTNLVKYNDDLRVGTTFSFSIKDPRLWDRTSVPPIKKPMSYADLIIALSQGSVDEESICNLMDPQARNESYNDQLTTKTLATKPDPNTVKESIPVLLTKTDISWTLIVPWFWVLPIWLKLSRQPKNVHLGGLKQLKQLRFENDLQGMEDYPYLPTSWTDNELEMKLNMDKYKRLPFSKQQRQKYENGMIPFGNDWEFLHKSIMIKHFLGVDHLPDTKEFGQFTEYMTKQIKSINDLVDHINGSRSYTLCIEPFDETNQFHNDFANHKANFTAYEMHTLPKLPINQISFELEDGAVTANSRIYLNDTNIQNLVGFVTTGNFNLNKGKCTGIGHISSHVKQEDFENLVIRNVGATLSYKIKVNSK